jgi:hypothetical protein
MKMNLLKLICVFIILLSLFGCEPPVTFNEPQPIDTNNLTIFPKRLQGEYVSLLDNSTLLINGKLIQRIYDYDYKFHLDQLDSTLMLSGDTIIEIKTNEKTLIKRFSDTLINHVHYIDTIFQMNDDNVVKKFKGYYFLNTRYNATGWEVKKLQLEKGQLIISAISAISDIENLIEITETTNDTVPPFKISATKRQFKMFIKNDGFADREVFLRVKKKITSL